MPHDDLAWADLSAADDPALVAWLADASCDPHVKALVVAAVHACDRPPGDAPRRAAEGGATAMRVDYYKEFPAGAEAMVGLERAVRSSGLEPGLLELVKIRASQVNGCTYCLAMHNRDARARGEHQTRLDTVTAWREAPYYTPRERAALAWCEALTELPHTGASDEDYAAVEQEFTPAEIAALTFVIVAINGWNRLAAGLRSDVLSLDGLDLPAGAGQEAGPGGAAR